jgi:lipopolysaccharide export system permease protein
MSNAPVTLRIYVMRLFAPIFVGAIVFFMLIVELIDLFGNLWRYLALDVPGLQILKVGLLYLPTCLSYALPVALLFATAYTLGSLYARNELIAIFSAGNRLSSFVAPLLAMGVLLSVFTFFFSDQVVLGSYRQKNEYSKKLLGQSISLSNSDVAVIARDGRLVYRAEYYDDAGRTLSRVTILERGAEGRPVSRTQASSASWDGRHWVLNNARRFELDKEGRWTEQDFGSYRSDDLDEPPSTFRSQNLDVNEMSVSQLGDYVSFLKRAGLPFQAALAERHKRFAFSFAPFIVVLISSALGGSFRKNVLLMSLLSSLVVATGYYVTQMMTMLMAKTGILAPAAGAWIPLALFGSLGVLLFRRART